jgi:hypothetical protein
MYNAKGTFGRRELGKGIRETRGQICSRVERVRTSRRGWCAGYDPSAQDAMRDQGRERGIGIKWY